MSQTYYSESDTVCLYFRHLHAQEGTELSTDYKIHAKESQQDSAAYVSRPCPLNPPLYVRQPVWTSCCENVTWWEEGSWGGGGGGARRVGGGRNRQTDRLAYNYKGRPKDRQILKRWRTSCIAKSLHNFFIAAYTICYSRLSRGKGVETDRLTDI